MQTHRRSLLVAASLTALLAGCGKEANKPKEQSSASNDAPTIVEVAKQAKGFDIGNLMAAKTVYVFFDPQCPHCARLWQDSKSLQKQLKFHWIPVSVMNPKSTTQAAAILSAKSPIEAMNIHETLILSTQGKGGIDDSASVTPEMFAAIKKNTELLGRLGAKSIPHIYAEHLQTGKIVSNAGNMPAAELATMVGLNLNN